MSHKAMPTDKAARFAESLLMTAIGDPNLAPFEKAICRDVAEYAEDGQWLPDQMRRIADEFEAVAEDLTKASALAGKIADRLERTRRDTVETIAQEIARAFGQAVRLDAPINGPDAVDALVRLVKAVNRCDRL